MAWKTGKRGAFDKFVFAAGGRVGLGSCEERLATFHIKKNIRVYPFSLVKP